ncbi:hypothetical protein E3N88_20690 [Mikania micrantha]|uniref:Uncharacterized protein n=1 Tax=Mikania micrantha TaxID=192012 RepID=A0A5N6NK66_9ASTR|nr:hypothetical protein E3N88_20690 [Mikania micrantha]
MRRRIRYCTVPGETPVKMGRRDYVGFIWNRADVVKLFLDISLPSNPPWILTIKTPSHTEGKVGSDKMTIEIHLILYERR